MSRIKLTVKDCLEKICLELSGGDIILDRCLYALLSMRGYYGTRDIVYILQVGHTKMLGGRKEVAVRFG